MVGAFLAGIWYANERSSQKIKDHPLLARRIFLENPNDTIINFEPLRSKLRQELAHYGENSSLYFEYLPTGTSIRIGDSTQLIGASLLKLPYVMDLYHLAEIGKINLQSKVQLKAEWLDTAYGQLHQRGAGAELTVRELAQAALRYSDNTAINGVRALVDEQRLPPQESSFHALDIEFATTEAATISLTARSFSSFLKCLYFSCYLAPDHSQELLQELSVGSVGGDRLPKYLPTDLTIAHKIGVLGQAVQSDCGIVYVQKRHYVLCVILKESQDRGSEVIAQLSKYVYDYVKNR